VEPFNGAVVLVSKGNGEEGKRGDGEVIGRWLFEGAEGGEPTEERSSGATGDARRHTARPEERDDHKGRLGWSGLHRPIGQLGRSGPHRSGGACWAGAK
jgi:hypothetical protein